VQAFWLREFFRPPSQVSSAMLDLAPFYALGNFCIGTWPFFVRLFDQRSSIHADSAQLHFPTHLFRYPECSVSNIANRFRHRESNAFASFIGNSEKLKTADWFVIVNTLQSLYWVYFRRVMNPTTYQDKLTNLVAISFAGVGILE
jgi:hypothetical protein